MFGGTLYNKECIRKENNMGPIDKEKVIAEIKELYNDIDKCISELIAARGNRDGNGISNAHWRMETLMVNTQQAICNVIDTFETKEEEKAFIEKAWDWIEDNILSSNQQDKSLLYYEQFKNYIKE